MNTEPPADQAQGLRRIFTPPHAVARTIDEVRLLPVVANPHAAPGGALLERLCAAFVEQGCEVLVVDADQRCAGDPDQPLASRIEPLGPQLWYLAASGLSLRHVDARGSCARFLQALIEAAPQAEVILVHADATELCRLFATRGVRPLLLAGDHPAAVTHAYAALKLLASRAGLMSHDLLISAAAGSPRIGRIAQRLSTCADAFVGAALHDWAHLDPTSVAPAGPALARLIRAQLRPPPAGATAWPPDDTPTPAPAAALSH